MSEQPHGTRNRYLGGCRCDLCRGANAEYMSDYRARNMPGWQRGYKRMKAREWAMRKLAERHPGEFTALLAVELTDRNQEKDPAAEQSVRVR